jgi:hypothetical protein
MGLMQGVVGSCEHGQTSSTQEDLELPEVPKIHVYRWAAYALHAIGSVRSTLVTNLETYTFQTFKRFLLYTTTMKVLQNLAHPEPRPLTGSFHRAIKDLEAQGDEFRVFDLYAMHWEVQIDRDDCLQLEGNNPNERRQGIERRLLL